MYGIEEIDKNYIDEMISKQIYFLRSNDLNVVSATVTPKKYLAELYNRINAMTELSKEDNLVPVFITITAPSRYHNSGLNYNNSTPGNTAFYLSLVWAKFLRSNVFKRIKKDKLKYHYFRTYEPHKSGVPHLHSMLYVPLKYVIDIKKALVFQMQNEQIKQYKYLFQFKNKQYKSNYAGSAAYIIKYINKSLFNTKDGSLNDIAYWYAKHGIRRFLTSRSLVPLFIYRKLNYLDNFKDMKTVTIHLRNNRIVLSERRTEINYYYFDKDELVYTDRMLWSKPLKNPNSDDQIKLKLKEKEKVKKDIPIFDDTDLILGFYKNNKYVTIEDHILDKSYPLSFDCYSDTKLFRYVKELEKRIDNFEDVNIKRYAIFRNEAIRRDLIDDDIISPDLYDVFFEFLPK